ncbi:rho GTPase-activating protein 45-like isoform X1 [Argonauta hians]
MNVNCDEAPVVFVDQDDIIHLTQEVKNFSDALAKLKSVFTEGAICGDEIKVTAHEQLGEVLFTLRQVLQQYLALQSEDLFATAANLISKIKNHNYETNISLGGSQSFCDCIDKLALAFSSSVSEYLMGDIDTLYTTDITKSKSYEVITNPVNNNTTTHSAIEEIKNINAMGPDEVNTVLRQLDTGMEIALQRAKIWSKYLKDIIYYIDKKAQLETDFSKNLVRLAQSTRSTIIEDAFLPLQSVYCLLLNMDFEYASSCQKTQALLQANKFIRPLATRRAEHDKVRKMIKETWSREVKKMEDSISNLRKARSLYYSRKQENEKARELANKAETEMSIQGSSSSSTISTKVDKRKKIVDETMNRAMEAENCYKAHIVEANNRHHEMNKIKGDLLSKVYEQILLCDNTIKTVTVEYFDLLHTMTSPVPNQFMRLCESSKQYEPASKYADYVRSLQNTPTRQPEDLFVFKPYISTSKSDDKKSYVLSSSSQECSQIYDISNGTPSNTDILSQGIGMKDWPSGDLVSDSDSSHSEESSPPVSPRGPIALQSSSNVNSTEDLLHDDSEYSMSKSQKSDTSYGGIPSSSSIVTLNQSFLGKQCHTFGVRLEDHLKTFNTEVPLIIRKCLNEIERKGITIKGIYRVSGVKSKVESLCKQFEADPDGVDLQEQHPNVITSVLKMYLRQLPEPLLTFDAYGGFIQTAKDYNAGTISTEKTVERLKDLIDHLPPTNNKTTSLLISHLRQVSKESEENQMNASNLGIVFGPTLLRPFEGTASLSSLVDTFYQTMSIELLITYADDVFGEEMETVGSPPSQESTTTTTTTTTTAPEKPARVPSTKSSKKSGSSSQTESPTLEQQVSESFAVSSALPVSVADNASTTTTTTATTATIITTTTTSPLAQTSSTTTTTTTTTTTSTTSHDPISSDTALISNSKTETTQTKSDGKPKAPHEEERILEQQQQQQQPQQQLQLLQTSHQKSQQPIHCHDVILTEPKTFHLSHKSKQKSCHELSAIDIPKRRNDHPYLILSKSYDKKLSAPPPPSASQRTDYKDYKTSCLPNYYSDDGVMLTAARSLDSVTTSLNTAATTTTTINTSNTTFSRLNRPTSEHAITSAVAATTSTTTTNDPTPVATGTVAVSASAIHKIKSPSVVTAKMCVKTTAPKTNPPPQRYRDDGPMLPGLTPCSKPAGHHRALTGSSSAPVVLTSIVPIEPKMTAVPEGHLAHKPVTTTATTTSKASSMSLVSSSSLDMVCSSSSSVELPSLITGSSSDERQPRFV